jgi:N-acetylglutamate synthase-like GNAT family acetyltransferase
MERKRFSRVLRLESGQAVQLRRARPKEAAAVRELYDDVYGGAYPLSLIRDPAELAATLADPSHFWAVLEHDKRLIGSVLFTVDAGDGIGKVFGAVVRPEYRGNDLTQRAIAKMVEAVTAGPQPLDVLYATTRTVTPAPAKLVRRLGFVNCGVFPNVHRVSVLETHGLDVLARPEALEARLRRPQLIPEVAEFYAIVRESLNLPDEADLVEMPAPPPVDLHLGFEVLEEVAAVRELYRARLAEHRLRYCFFPFHEPHLLCHTKAHADEVFLHRNDADGHGAILGISSERPEFGGLLDQLSQAAERLGFRYIELLVSAFDPGKQREAVAARFLPCAYFPAMKRTVAGRRMDYLVFSRSFENLDFTGIQLDGAARRYLQAFMQGWYAMLLARAPDFERENKLF